MGIRQGGLGRLNGQTRRCATGRPTTRPLWSLQARPHAHGCPSFQFEQVTWRQLATTEGRKTDVKTQGNSFYFVARPGGRARVAAPACRPRPAAAALRDRCNSCSGAGWAQPRQAHMLLRFFRVGSAQGQPSAASCQLPHAPSAFSRSLSAFFSRALRSSRPRAAASGGGTAGWEGGRRVGGRRSGQGATRGGAGGGCRCQRTVATSGCCQRQGTPSHHRLLSSAPTCIADLTVLVVHVAHKAVLVGEALRGGAGWKGGRSAGNTSRQRRQWAAHMRSGNPSRPQHHTVVYATNDAHRHAQPAAPSQRPAHKHSPTSTRTWARAHSRTDTMRSCSGWNTWPTCGAECRGGGAVVGEWGSSRR